MKLVLIEFPNDIDIQIMPVGAAVSMTDGAATLAGKIYGLTQFPDPPAPQPPTLVQHNHVLGADTDPGAVTGPAVPV